MLTPSFLKLIWGSENLLTWGSFEGVIYNPSDSTSALNAKFRAYFYFISDLSIRLFPTETELNQDFINGLTDDEFLELR